MAAGPFVVRAGAGRDGLAGALPAFGAAAHGDGVDTGVCEQINCGQAAAARATDQIDALIAGHVANPLRELVQRHRPGARHVPGGVLIGLPYVDHHGAVGAGGGEAR
jgi:hypothetical protein